MQAVRRGLWGGMAALCCAAMIACSWPAVAGTVVLVERLNDPLLPGANVNDDYVVSPDGAWVFYKAQQVGDARSTLYRVPADRAIGPQRVPALFGADNPVSSFQVTSDSAFLIFLSVQDTQNQEIFSVPVGGGAAQITLNEKLGEGGSVSSFILSPDGSLVVFTAQLEDGGPRNYFSAPTDGTGKATQISEVGAGGGLLFGRYISPDSQWVVYRSSQDSPGFQQLYSRPSDGSDRSVQLNGPLVSGGRVFDAQILADSEQVLYTATQDDADMGELYLVPIDGSESSRKINAPLPDGRDVTDAMVSEQSKRVVYRADANQSGVFELFSAPLDGIGEVNPVNEPLLSGSVVADFQISPDGRWVVYRAEQDTAGVNDLYAAPIEGGEDTIRLSEPGTNDLGVQSQFQILPDSSAVVFRAEKEADNNSELYIRPIDGSSPMRELSDLMDSNDGTFGFDVSGDGAAVYYIANQGDSFPRELYYRSLESDFCLTLVNPELVPGGFVREVLALPQSSRVIYLAEQDTNDIDELYTASVVCVPVEPEGEGEGPLEGEAGAPDGEAGPPEGEAGSPEGEASPPAEGEAAPMDGEAGSPVEGEAGSPLEGEAGPPVEGEAGTPGGEASPPIDGEADPFDGEAMSEDGEAFTPTEGEGEGDPDEPHDADQDGDGTITLGELLRVVQLLNAGEYQCGKEEGSEDGFTADGTGVPVGVDDCAPHSADYIGRDGVISLSELLRMIQFYSLGVIKPCPGESEDGYCAPL